MIILIHIDCLWIHLVYMIPVRRNRTEILKTLHIVVRIRQDGEFCKLAGAEQDTPTIVRCISPAWRHETFNKIIIISQSNSIKMIIYNSKKFSIYDTDNDLDLNNSCALRKYLSSWCSIVV